MQDWKGELNSSVETNLLGHGQFSNCTNTECSHWKGMKWENLVSVYRCRQSSRVVTSGQAKQKQNCRQFSTEINRVQLLWHPLCPSPFYPNLASPCRSQQVCLIFFPQAVTGTLCRGRQEVAVGARGTPRGVLVAKWDMLKLQSQQRKMCANTSWSPVASQELCKKMRPGESQSTNTDLGNKGTDSVKINMSVMKDWKAFEQIELDLDLNHIVKINSNCSGPADAAWWNCELTEISVC